jgi:rubrerythrin
VTAEGTGEWDSIDDLLEFAIDKEEDAAMLYINLADRAESAAMRSTLMELAAMEKGHAAKLLNVRKSGDLTRAGGKVLDLKIADYLVDVEPTADMDYQKVLTIAIKREQASQNLYADLAAAADDRELKDLMMALSQEEAEHKFRFETEYDAFILADD